MTWQNTKNICFVAALAFFLHSISIPKGVCADDAEILKPTTDFTKPEKYEANSAGALTSKNLLSNNAFSQGSPNLSFEKNFCLRSATGSSNGSGFPPQLQLKHLTDLVRCLIPVPVSGVI